MQLKDCLQKQIKKYTQLKYNKLLPIEKADQFELQGCRGCIHIPPYGSPQIEQQRYKCKGSKRA